MPVYERAIDLMEAELGDELVALDPDAGNCFGFNNVAASVWRTLREPKSLDELRAAMLEEYDVEPAQCDEDLKELLDDLCARGLVRVS